MRLYFSVREETLSTTKLPQTTQKHEMQPNYSYKLL